MYLNLIQYIIFIKIPKSLFDLMITICIHSKFFYFEFQLLADHDSVNFKMCVNLIDFLRLFIDFFLKSCQATTNSLSSAVQEIHLAR